MTETSTPRSTSSRSRQPSTVFSECWTIVRVLEGYGWKSGDLPAGPPQRCLKFGPLLSPSRFFRPGLLFEIFDPGLNAGRVLVMPPAGRVQGALRPIDIVLPSFTLFALSHFLLCAFALSARLLLLECLRGLAIRR